MHVGGDYHSIAGGPSADMTAKANLYYNLRHGVKHLTAQVRKIGPDGAWDSDELKRMKDNCEKAGITFEAIRMDSEYIMLPKGARSAIASLRSSWGISARHPRPESRSSRTTGP